LAFRQNHEHRDFLYHGDSSRISRKKHKKVVMMINFLFKRNYILSIICLLPKIGPKFEIFANIKKKYQEQKRQQCESLLFIYKGKTCDIMYMLYTKVKSLTLVRVRELCWFLVRLGGKWGTYMDILICTQFRDKTKETNSFFVIIRMLYGQSHMTHFWVCLTWVMIDVAWYREVNCPYKCLYNCKIYRSL
jgi:hypothetical protein